MGRRKKSNLTMKTLAIVLSMVLVLAFGGTAAFAAGAAPTGISYKDDTVFKADKGADVSINVMDADIRDILSLFATKLGVNIVYLGDAYTTSYAISGVDATTAFEIFIKSTAMDGSGLSFVRDEDLILVGPPGSLEESFSDMLVFTSFELQYMTSDELIDYLEVLGVNVNYFTVDQMTNRLFVQGFPYEVAKVNEIVNILDNTAYYPEGGTAFNLVSYGLKYISASTLDGVISELGVEADTIILDSSPMTLWVSADSDQHTVISQLVSKLDIAANVSGNEFGIYRLKYINIELVNNAMDELGLWTTAEGETGPVTVIPNTLISENPYAILVNFKNVNKDIVDFLISELDTPSNLPENPAFFIYTFANISAESAIGRIEAFGEKKTFNSDEVEFKEFSFSGLGSQLMVLSTKSEEADVRAFLSEIDKPGKKMAVVVDYSSGNMQARLRLVDRIPLISYISGVPEANFFVSGDISKDSTPAYVTWVEDTPENIEKVKAAIANIDSSD